MRRMWMLGLIFTPLFLMNGSGVGDVPAHQIVLKAQANVEPKGDLYFVAISQEPGMNFLVHGFERAMTEAGKPLYREIHGKVLKGAAASKKSLLENLDWMVENAKENDTVMLFVACHGSCNAKGESVFATSDGKTVFPREIKSRFAKLPCHAIVINDACCSGNWPKDTPDDPMPPNVSALCCCLSSQSSAIQFDITMFEALHGKADFNKDGIVDLDEVIKYCGLRIREVQDGKLIPVLHKATNVTTRFPLTKANPNLVSVVHLNKKEKKLEVFAAIVENQDGDDFEVSVLGFGRKGERAGFGGNDVGTKFNRSNVILPTDGASVMVRKEAGGWHPACLLGKDGDNCKVRFVGTDDQVSVPTDEVRYLFAGDPTVEIARGLFKTR